MNKSISCSPTGFNITTCEMDPQLVALMMPFDERFNRVCKAIKSAAKSLSLNCERVDDIYENSVLVQDIFTLIFKASIIVCDCSDKNPNVLYETGIAHLLGRSVILIAQNLDDIPFDLRHHRIITYLNNSEGLRTLKKALTSRMKTLMGKVEDYISIPRQGADEITIRKVWHHPKSQSGGIAPLQAEAIETIKFPQE